MMAEGSTTELSMIEQRRMAAAESMTEPRRMATAQIQSLFAGLPEGSRLDRTSNRRDLPPQQSVCSFRPRSLDVIDSVTFTASNPRIHLGKLISLGISLEYNACRNVTCKGTRLLLQNASTYHQEHSDPETVMIYMKCFNFSAEMAIQVSDRGWVAMAGATHFIEPTDECSIALEEALEAAFGNKMPTSALNFNTQV